VVALEEDGSPITGLDGCGQDSGGVLDRTLTGIADLRPGDFEDKGSRIGRQGCPEDCLGGVVGESPDVDCRDGESPDLSLSDGLVESLD